VPGQGHIMFCAGRELVDETLDTVASNVSSSFLRHKRMQDEDRAPEDAGRRVLRPDGPGAGGGPDAGARSLPSAERHARGGGGRTATSPPRAVRCRRRFGVDATALLLRLRDQHRAGRAGVLQLSTASCWTSAGCKSAASRCSGRRCRSTPPRTRSTPSCVGARSSASWCTSDRMCGWAEAGLSSRPVMVARYLGRAKRHRAKKSDERPIDRSAGRLADPHPYRAADPLARSGREGARCRLHVGEQRVVVAVRAISSDEIRKWYQQVESPMALWRLHCQGFRLHLTPRLLPREA
jgi:hypothetical protein